MQVFLSVKNTVYHKHKFQFYLDIFSVNQPHK